MSTFADKLRKTREAATMLQKDLANKAGLSQRIISKYERGEAFPRGATLYKLADALGVSVDYLLIDDQRIEKNPYIERQYDASELLEGTTALFASGSLDEENLELINNYRYKLPARVAGNLLCRYVFRQMGH
ncbi:MAG: helix-turn-helix domain-containing protein [Gracilibacteraceae bacterium]|jgi:transcriptional regulator with XRE-family HTH domain|nr:helix-turn-helix domain-containing protein [Gracilibacteraceae bacterium]